MRPTHPTKFVMQPVALNDEGHELRFCYEHHFADASAEHYTEVLTLPAELWNMNLLRGEHVQRLFTQLSLALGLSYWKMYCPNELIPPQALMQHEAVAWNMIYRDALGEFFFRNRLDPFARIPFTGHDEPSPAPPRDTTPNLAIVPFGGGKDSLLTAHLLRQRKIPFEAFTLGTSFVQQQGLHAMGIDARVIQRVLDPTMIRKSKAGEAYNGHVSITLIYALTAALVALLRDARWVVFSNEWSASEGNTHWKGVDINHQWSKSLEAERLIRDLVHTNVASDLTIFSLLRPLTEIGIVTRVTRELPHLFGSFSSCNRNFVISRDRPASDKNRAYWCGTCPKCAFVGLLFATVLSPQGLERLMDSNPLANTDLIPLYRDLLGLGNLKPFECVGTFDETRACFAHLSQHPEYQHLPILQWWKDQSIVRAPAPSLDEYTQPIPQAVTELPPIFRSIYPRDENKCRIPRTS